MRSIALYLAWGKLGGLPDSKAVFAVSEKFAAEPVSSMLAAKWLFPDNIVKWESVPSEPVSRLLEPFAKGLHRILVRLHDHEVRGDFSLETKYAVVTQTDLVRWIFHSHAAFARALDATLSGEHFVKEVTSVKSDESAVEALIATSKYFLPAAPVVTRHDGALVATLSASDLRGLEAVTLTDLNLQVVTFLEKHAPASMRPVSAGPETTLREAIQLLLRNGMHRLWIVDAQSRPIGVVSMTDICARVSKLP
jgi:CBS domain-containing protein